MVKEKLYFKLANGFLRPLDHRLYGGALDLLINVTMQGGESHL